MCDSTLNFPASPEKERKAIQITLPDGNVKEGTSWETSPMSIALSISKGLAEKMVVAKVVKKSLIATTQLIVSLG